MTWKTLATTALAGCLFAFAGQAADLRIALQDDPDMLDPAQSRSFVGRIVYASLCDKLVDINENVEFVPMLATDWSTSDDGLKLVMNLREGVTFHDGEPMNAEAVVYTITRNMTLAESRRKSELASVDKVEATGPLQVTFTLKKPDASLVAQLSDRAGMIVSPKAAEAAGANFGANPVCAGPFKFVERIAQDRIVLEKFADYWDAGNFHIDRVTFTPIPDSTVRLANLRSGDVQLVDRIAATDAATVQGDASLGYAEAVGLGSMGMYVNIGNGDNAQKPMGQSKALRQAFSMAIDREAINQVVFSGTALAGNQPWPPTSPWYNKDIPVQPRDIEKAKALVKEAGVDRIAVTLKHHNNPVVTQTMQMIQAMVAEAGFDVSLISTEFATLLNNQSTGDYEMTRSDWSGRPDPDGNVHQFYHSKGGLNDMKYANPEVDALLDGARASSDPAERKAKYDAFAAIVTDELPIITFGHQKFLYGFTATLTGFEAYPDAMIRLKGVKLDN
ncbi:peptide/nickel transport system substrate-binding protein [Gemmobacter megaterium]|uniref:Peptide/nickel transport system substrate-binding protein n=1 Tax=Gemmobacter megaterium TaxID=1086013 RepID=A0A1N7Q632_9RHOB|nr:ABC transporter substrate-binding protein [Gemmobacter megaterium]GGE23384.1 peptide ABC transporter substrate-binding protein [Gemmobacter megaterium]SIT18303.1 peptide/nickel transport system substrate-binding protein [Gemmobacter megaterium]